MWGLRERGEAVWNGDGRSKERKAVRSDHARGDSGTFHWLVGKDTAEKGDDREGDGVEVRRNESEKGRY